MNSPRSHTPPGFTFQPVGTRLRDDILAMPELPKLLNIVAPIGYGKTVLMTELHGRLREQGHDCRWVGLDDRNASVERVLGALQGQLASPRASVHPTQALWRGDEPLERRIDALLEVLGRLRAPVTLFIDNLNSCTEEGLGALLDALVFRTPASVRLVWSGTNELSIDLARAKLEGRARHIGFQELCLDGEETGRLLGAQLCRRIGQAGVDAVQARTEGWPAAVRMAQIVLAASDQPLAALDAFSGSDEDIAALLNRQVLRRFTPEQREFMLCVSQLRTFSASLCRQAIASDAAEAHLGFLLQHNVFIVPLDRNRNRYRLHGLFREYLSREAALRLSPQRRAQVLARASHWCEQTGEWHDAIDYAFGAGELVTAARLVERSAHFFVRETGDIQRFVSWVDQLRAADVAIGWDTQYWYVWALVFQRRYERSVQQHALLAQRFAGRGDAACAPRDLGQRIQHLRICIDFFADRMDEAEQGIEAWLRENTAASPYANGSIGCVKALCLATSLKLEQAWKTMRAVQPVLLEIDGADMVGWISLIHAVLMAYEGDYARARAELTSGLAEARQRLGEDAVLCGTMALVAAHAAVAMGLADEARELQEFGLRSARNHTALDLVACGLEAAVKLWDGHEDARGTIARLRELAAAYPPRLSLMLSCHLIRRLIRLGRLDDALAQAERIGLHPDRDDAVEALQAELAVPRFRDLWAATAIDVLIATRRYKRADALVSREYRIAKDDGRAGRLVELGLAKATLALQGGDDAAAGRALAGALSRAARRRIVRPFEEHAALFEALTRAGKTSAWSFALAEERAFFEDISRRLAQHNPPAAESTPHGADAATMTAPTAREAELLVMLDMGLSNQEMADRAQLSITTIKWHLKNLYRKFGVSTRTAVLARARALGP
ncbi:MAG TPA: LuxR C-terminal-related transcriptional regulator [Ramlibacter sp.]|nr:LuxR C-terminal-related transcriptional regulator [Ramlibacter sp.]